MLLRDLLHADPHAQPGVARLLLGHADPADLGIGEGDPGQAVVAAERLVLAEQVGGQHACLPDRQVGERAVAGDVADRVQAVDGAPSCSARMWSSTVIDGRRRVEPDGVEADVAQVGHPARGDEQPWPR